MKHRLSGVLRRQSEIVIFAAMRWIGYVACFVSFMGCRNNAEVTNVFRTADPEHVGIWLAAAWEVSLSRFYGGIHYTNSVQQGYNQGKFIAETVLNELK